MNINHVLLMIFTFFMVLALSAMLGREANGGARKHEEYVIKDNRGVRIGRVVTDHVRGGYKLQNNYGVTKSRIKTNRLPSKLTIERKKR